VPSQMVARSTQPFWRAILVLVILSLSTRDKLPSHQSRVGSLRVGNPIRHNREERLTLRQIRRVNQRRNPPLPLALTEVNPRLRRMRHNMTTSWTIRHVRDGAGRRVHLVAGVESPDEFGVRVGLARGSLLSLRRLLCQD
jgi:hypothetical protein